MQEKHDSTELHCAVSHFQHSHLPLGAHGKVFLGPKVHQHPRKPYLDYCYHIICPRHVICPPNSSRSLDHRSHQYFFIDTQCCDPNHWDNSGYKKSYSNSMGDKFSAHRGMRVYGFGSFLEQLLTETIRKLDSLKHLSQVHSCGNNRRGFLDLGTPDSDLRKRRLHPEHSQQLIP